MSGMKKKRAATKAKLTPAKKLYMIEVMSTFRMRYVVEAEELEHAMDEYVMRENDIDFKEFSQEHIGTHIFSSREISDKEYFEIFNQDNSYLSTWPKEDKIEFINKIDYKDEKDSSNGK